MITKVPRPGNDEFAEFHQGYMNAVAHEPDGLAALERQVPIIESLGRLTTEQAGFRYEAGKWSPKQIIGHLTDSERVFAYRLLSVARGEQATLPGFDEKTYAEHSNADRREVVDLAGEFLAVRRSTIALVRSLDEEMLVRRGRVNDWTLSARALVFIIAGHVAHHARILRERYGISVD